jgi:glycosyltransferase involved in cell wall biosynthesis
MSSPLVSVVIPSHNRADYVIEAVESALGQTYPHVEVIVVDDGSTDETRTLLEPYGDRITYIYQTNAGVSAARNAGIRRSNGEWVAFLDSDDVWLPEKLKAQVDCALAHPHADLVHTDAFYCRATSDQRTIRPTANPPMEGDCYTRLFAGNRLITSSVMARRSALDQDQPFDTELRGTEDYLCWFRIARRRPFAFVQQPLVLYRLHDSNTINNKSKMDRNVLLALDKALADDPQLAERVGKAAVRSRYADLWYYLGYRSLEQGNFREARQALLQTLRYDRQPRVWGMLLSLALPGSVIPRVRRLKQRAARWFAGNAPAFAGGPGGSAS